MSTDTLADEEDERGAQASLKLISNLLLIIKVKKSYFNE